MRDWRKWLLAGTLAVACYVGLVWPEAADVPSFSPSHVTDIAHVGLPPRVLWIETSGGHWPTEESDPALQAAADVWNDLSARPRFAVCSQIDCSPGDVHVYWTDDWVEQDRAMGGHHFHYLLQQQLLHRDRYVDVVRELELVESGWIAEVPSGRPVWRGPLQSVFILLHHTSDDRHRSLALVHALGHALGFSHTTGVMASDFLTATEPSDIFPPADIELLQQL